MEKLPVKTTPPPAEHRPTSDFARGLMFAIPAGVVCWLLIGVAVREVLS